MKNNFRENGRMLIRYETPEERREILRILEEQCGFRVEEEQKEMTEIQPQSTRTFDINLKTRTICYDVRPMIGAAMMSSGIRFYSAGEFFRIAELDFETVPRFPVFHVPHAGWKFPNELLLSVCVPEERFRHYHDLMSDSEAWRFVPRAYYGGDMTARFDLSRLMCDVERFIGPEEEMEQYGMGFCYERAFDGTRIKIVTDEVREQTRKYYDAHHARMNRLCERHPRILLFDMHSFSEESLPKHIRNRCDRLPDICIGTDPDCTPNELVRRIRRRADEFGMVCMDNTPYRGTFVPNAVLKENCNCDLVSVMLEFNKKLYLDEHGKVNEEKAHRISRLMDCIIADCVDMG